MHAIPIFRRLARWSALCSLALQIAVSFGHLHVEGLHRAPASVGVSGFAAKARSHPAPQSGDDDYCAICANIYLASTSFMPPAPSLPVPFASRPVEHVDRATNDFVAPRRTPFRSRAPPG